MTYRERQRLADIQAANRCHPLPFATSRYFDTDHAVLRTTVDNDLYYGRPPLLERLLLPDDAQRPARKYLDWHQTNVFIA